MECPKDYAKNGPTYKDQMYDGYKNYYSPEDPNYTDQFPEIWDNCMMLCEHVHNERIRNKLSPIVNLIAIVNAAVDRMDDNLESTLNNLNRIKELKLIDTCKTSVEQLLDIPNQ